MARLWLALYVPFAVTVVDDILVNTSSFSKGNGGEFLNPCHGNCGGWTGVGTGFWDDRFYTTADGGGTIDQWTKWQPTALPTYNGIYEVFVYVPDNNATSWQAPYKIIHADGTSMAVVDQYGLSNQWVSIGAYRMNANSYVSTRDATGENYNQHCPGGWCQLGVDAIKFVRHATYAPDVRYGSGWTSTVTLRNNGGGYSKTNVNFLKSDGTLACQAAPFLGAHQSISYYCPNTSVAVAIVEGSQELSVVVENIYDSSGRYLAYAYPGQTQPALVHYAPLVLKRWPTLNSSWRQTTDLLLFNPSPLSASVTVTFYDSWGSDTNGFKSVNLTIAPIERKIVYGTQMDTWEASLGGSLASARVESSQPLAVTTRNLVGVADGAGNITTPYLAGSYRAEGQPTNFYYTSTVAREYYGYDSSLQVQNTSASGTSFTISYYWLNQLNPAFTVNATVGPYRSANFWRPAGMPVNFFGSAKVESNSPLAVMAQYDRFDMGSSRYGVTQYEGVSSLNAATAMAHIQKEALYTPLWTYTGIQAQNRNASSVNIQLHYFNTDGTSAGSSVIKSNVPANAAVNFWATPAEIPVFNGSGISGVGNLALLVNFDRLGDPGWQNKDGMMGYAAVK